MALILFECQKDIQLNPLFYRIFVTVQHPHRTSPLPLSPPQLGGQGEETFFPRPWWDVLGGG